MNEVTRIHLGRQSYTISVEAHHNLKKYLSDIQKKVADPEVANEVELRMSELLMERGVTNEQVILPKDVEYLKQQLGSPDDFSDDEDTETPKSDDKGTKRLFRDTDTALVAGVASGLASYSGLDVVLIRLFFVLLTIFGGGSGIVLYILLWLVVPEAATASEKLQMQGRPVTLEALKDSVSNADVAGAAQRINSRVLPVVNGIFRTGIKFIGLGFVLAGLGMLISIGVTKMYMVLHNGRLFQENLFPVGAREEWLLAITMILAAVIAFFLILTGIAAFRRKWPIGGWITGVLAGMFLLGSVASIALTADAVPHVRERYQTSLHTTAIKDIKPFSKVTTTGEVDVEYISSPNYTVNLRYFDNPDLSKIKVTVENDTLHIDSSGLDGFDHCDMLCLFPDYDMTAQVYMPNAEDFGRSTHTNCKTFNDQEYCAEDYIGLSELEAVDKAKREGQIYRVVQRDEESFPVTLDFNEHRINFTVQDDEVTKAEFY